MQGNNNNYGVAKTEETAPAKTKNFSTFMVAYGNNVVSRTLTDPNRNKQFVANLISAVSSNPTLQECDQTSVLSAALQAEAMHFPINNSLGYVYLVPFKDKNRGCKVAQFQIGYKGYIQLAIRSGQYKSINVVEVKEGELGAYDPLNGQSFNWNSNYEKRKALKTIGYVGQFELINGFKTQLYISYEEMLDHADKYSQAFSKDNYIKLQKGEPIYDYNNKIVPEWKLSSFWYKNFDEMAKKTVLRQLLSKWGIMSIEMQEAYIKDQAEMKADGTYDYIDAKSASEAVENKQKEEMASVKVEVPETGEVVDAPKAETPEQPTEEAPEEFNYSL